VNNTPLCPSNERGTAKNFSSDPGHVYVIQDENNVIKIGHSTNPSKRIKQIQRCCGLCVVRQHISPLCYNHLEIENALLNEFSDRLKQGEHLQGVSFEEVCAALDKQPFQVVLLSDYTDKIIQFQFQGYQVRISTGEGGKVVFCLKDVCEALDIINPSRVVERLDKEGIFLVEVCDLTPVKVTSRARKTQKMIFVDEPNLYRVIFKSDKPDAVTFQNWVFKEVLPQIRQKGYYSLYGQMMPSTQSLVNDIAQNTVAKITETLAPLTQNPVVIVKTQEDGTVKKVEVSFRVKLSFEIKEV